jgi:hypothetical protein
MNFSFPLVLKFGYFYVLQDSNKQVLLLLEISHFLLFLQLTFSKTDNFRIMTNQHINKNKMAFTVRKKMVQMHFDLLNNYVNNMDEFLDNQGKDIEELIRAFQKPVEAPSDYPEASDYYVDEIYHYQEFKGIFYKSVYLSIFTVFEDNMRQICWWCYKVYAISKSPGDYKNNYLENYKTYLEIYLNIDFSNLNYLFKKILDHRSLRNSITHSWED